MISPRLASLRLVLRAALLLSLTGCGTYTGTKAPQPVASSPSSALSVATTGLRLGYLWQSTSRNVYPILGVTAAAHYGSAVLPDDSKSVKAAAITTSSGAWALVLGADGVLRQWDLVGQTAVGLSGNIPSDSQIWFSPSGSSAMVISASLPTALVIIGLPAKPQLTSVPLPSGFTLPDATVSDTGTLLIGVNRAGMAGAEVGVISPTQSYTPITRVQAWGGAAFVPGQSSDAAVIADAGAAQVVLASHLTGGSPVLTTVPVGEALESAAGVAVSADGKWAYIWDPVKLQIVRASLSGSGTPTAISCACTPRQMIPLTSDGIFSLTQDVAGQADWILDTRTTAPRSFFVPVNSASAQTATSAHVSKASNRILP
jgi:hypothetical protein